MNRMWVVLLDGRPFAVRRRGMTLSHPRLALATKACAETRMAELQRVFGLAPGRLRVAAYEGDEEDDLAL